MSNCIKSSVSKLAKKLKYDLDYRDVWRANIAVCFQDEYYKFDVLTRDKSTIHAMSNRAAENFINLLIADVENE